MKNLSLIVGALLISGCAAQNYSYSASSVSGVNAPEKLSAGWTYSIDSSVKDARRNSFKPTSHPCSLHIYNLDGAPAIESAIRKGMEDFLDGGSEQSATAGPRNIAFKLDMYQPRFSCAIGSVEGHCNGTAEIGLTVTITKDGTRKSFSVSSERTADASGGRMCATALAAPAEATRKAAKDVVERAMERVVSAIR